jgi:hypothetical protein
LLLAAEAAALMRQEKLEALLAEVVAVQPKETKMCMAHKVKEVLAATQAR